MAQILTIQYNSLRDFCVQRRLMLPRPTETWRLVKDAPVGEIIGLPTLRGRAVATNGIIVAIEFLSGRVEFGHLDWFKCDKQEDEKVMVKERMSNASSVRMKSVMFDALMQDFV